MILVRRRGRKKYGGDSSDYDGSRVHNYDDVNGGGGGGGGS